VLIGPLLYRRGYMASGSRYYISKVTRSPAGVCPAGVCRVYGWVMQLASELIKTLQSDHIPPISRTWLTTLGLDYQTGLLCKSREARANMADVVRQFADFGRKNSAP
jgi:hypothetical protein